MKGPDETGTRVLLVALLGAVLLATLFFLPAVYALDVNPYFSLLFLGGVYAGYFVLTLGFLLALRSRSGYYRQQLDRLVSMLEAEGSVETRELNGVFARLASRIEKLKKRIQRQRNEITRLRDRKSELAELSSRWKAEAEVGVNESKARLSTLEEEILDYISSFSRVESGVKSVDSLTGRMNANLSEVVSIFENFRASRLELGERVRTVQNRLNNFLEIFEKFSDGVEAEFGDSVDEFYETIRDLRELANNLRLEAQRDESSSGVAELGERLCEELDALLHSSEGMKENFEKTRTRLEDDGRDLRRSVEDLEIGSLVDEARKSPLIRRFEESCEQVEKLLDKQVEKLRELESTCDRLDAFSTDFTEELCLLDESLDRIESQVREKSGEELDG